MEPDLTLMTYVRKPFMVDAVQITEENIAEVAKYVGELREKEDGTPFIFVNRRLVPNIYRVYPGYWMTKMGDNIRCYSDKVFTEQFMLHETMMVGELKSVDAELESFVLPRGPLQPDVVLVVNPPIAE